MEENKTEQPSKELTGLQKFKEIDGIIAEYKKEYSGLTITGIDDKEGYKRVHDARIIVKAKRVEVDKLRKAITEEARIFVNNVNTEGNRIINELKAIEDPLDKMESDIDAEKERIKQEKIMAEKLRVQNRVNRLFTLGASYDGTTYTIGAQGILEKDLATYSDIDFDTRMADLEQEANRLKLEREAEEQRKKEEADRLELQRKEQEAERIRLDEQKRLQEAETKRLQDEADQLQRQKLLMEQREAKRIQDEKDAEERRIRDEQIRKEAEEKAEADKLAAIEKAKQDERDRIANEAAEKLAAEQLAKEQAAQLAALAPDKDKIIAFANAVQLAACDIPVLVTPEATELLNTAVQQLEKLIVSLKAEVEIL